MLPRKVRKSLQGCVFSTLLKRVPKACTKDCATGPRWYAQELSWPTLPETRCRDQNAKSHRGIWSTSCISSVGKQRPQWGEAGLPKVHPALSGLLVTCFVSFRDLKQRPSEVCLLLYGPRDDLTKGLLHMDLCPNSLHMHPCPNSDFQGAIMIPTQKSAPLGLPLVIHRVSLT